jgi:hypothetical protein
MSKSIFAAATLALLLTGCASIEGEFPSLAKRPYEDADPLAEPVLAPAPVTTTLPAELQTKLSTLLSRARTAQAAFETALPAAASAAQSAAGGTPGTEAWVNAHMLLSRADSARADAVAALGEIDRLIAGERERGADAGLVSLLSMQQNQIAILVSEQTAEIDRLTRLIGV